MLFFKHTVANHRQNIIWFHIYIKVGKYSEILLIVNHFTTIPSLRYFISCCPDEEAHMIQFPNGPVRLHRRCNFAKSSFYAHVQPWPPAQQPRKHTRIDRTPKSKRQHILTSLLGREEETACYQYIYCTIVFCLLSNHCHTEGHEANNIHNTCVPLGTHH